MTITRANSEVLLVKRAGALMKAAELDSTTVHGSNEDLNDPLANALLRLGLTVADVSLVTDADVAAVSAANTDVFFDLAEYRLAETIQGNLNDVDIRAGPLEEKLSQLARQVDRKLSRLRKHIESEHGIGAGSVDIGIINLNFTEHNDEDVIPV